jgi:hypothetical protein
MLSNTFVVSEFVEIFYSFPTWSCVNMCHTVQRPVPRTWQCVIWYHDQCISPGIMSYDTTTSVFHLAMYYAVPRPVQPSNMLYGTTTSAVHLAMCHAVPWPVQPSNICHTVPQPVYYTWQCAMRYHNQCISPGNMSYSTTTSAFHLAMCHAVPRPVQPSNMSYGTTTSVFHLAMWHTVPQPVYFTWQCGIRYHNQCLSPGSVMRYHDQCISPGNVFMRYHNQCLY